MIKHKTIVKIFTKFWCRFSTSLSFLQFIAFSIRMTYENNFCIRTGRFHEAPFQITAPPVTKSIRVKTTRKRGTVTKWQSISPVLGQKQGECACGAGDGEMPLWIIRENGLSLENPLFAFPVDNKAYSVRVKSKLLVCVFSRFQGIFENASKEKRELLFIVTPSFSVIRTNGLEPSRCYSLEPETSASTNSATCAFDWCGRSLAQLSWLCKLIP